MNWAHNVFSVPQLILKWQFWNKSGVYLSQTNQMAATQFLINQIWDTHVLCNNLAFDHVSPASCWFLSQNGYNVIICWSISKVRGKSPRSEDFLEYETLHEIWCNVSHTGKSSDITFTYLQRVKTFHNWHWLSPLNLLEKLLLWRPFLVASRWLLF